MSSETIRKDEFVYFLAEWRGKTVKLQDRTKACEDLYK